MKRKMYIIAQALLAALCLATLLSGMLFTPTGARADETAHNAPTTVVKPQTDCSYRYFTYPTAVYADGNGFTVADGNTAFGFGPNGTEKTSVTFPEDIGDISVLAPYSSAENTYILLSEGKLFISGETLVSAIDNPDEENRTVNYTDFIVHDNMLYATAGNGIYGISLTDPTGAPTALYTHEKATQKIAADTKGIYFTVANTYNRYQSDIFFVPFATLGNPAQNASYAYYYASDEILALEGREKGVVALTRDKITAYTVVGIDSTNAALIEEYGFICQNVVAVSAHEDTVYGLSQEKSIFKVERFAQRTEIRASAHGEQGFFRANAGLVSRKQMIAVADERNNRVQILHENGSIQTIDILRPKAVTIDYERNLYIAHDNRVDVYNNSYKAMRTLSVPQGVTIEALQIDSYNNLYALGNNRQVYYFTANSTVFDTTDMPSDVLALAVSPTDDALFVITATNGLECLHGKQTVEIATDVDTTVDICVDLNNSVYALTKSGTIVLYRKDGESYAPPQEFTPAEPFVNATQIVMNTAVFDESAHLDNGVTLVYGDLLVSDTGAHAVKRLDGELLLVNDGFAMQPLPDVDDIEWDAAQDGDRIIWTVETCDVYEQAAEINRVAGLHGGMRVIIPRYDENKPFQLIIADNVSGVNEPPILGYVRNAFLRERLPYAPPPSESCYSYLANASVYKFPTFNSPKLTNTLPRNTQFALLSFVHSDTIYGYTDNLAAPAVWYRVRYTDGGETFEGYIPCDSISMRGENPDDRNIYPRTNAKVIQKAVLYELIDGEMKEVTDAPFVPLEIGTEVEVVGAFDSSEKYTLIKYYHEGIGTVQFYVLTKTLKYRGVNKVTVIAIVLIVVTVILGVILVARFVYVKRTRKLSSEK